MTNKLNLLIRELSRFGNAEMRLRHIEPSDYHDRFEAVIELLVNGQVWATEPVSVSVYAGLFNSKEKLLAVMCDEIQAGVRRLSLEWAAYKYSFLWV